MFIWPEKFDENEWFILISLVVSYAFILKLPKRFPLSISLIMLVFSMTFAQVLDHVIAGKGMDLYDINDIEKYEVFDWIAWFLYPPFGYAFIYFYDKWSLCGVRTFWYIVLWCFIAIGEELLGLKFNMFTYHSWKVPYSVPIYLATLCVYLLFFLYIKKSYETLKDS